MCENDLAALHTSISLYVALLMLICLVYTDINECALDKGGCDHKCMNKGGSFHCVCEDGFTLLSDGKTCVEGMHF